MFVEDAGVGSSLKASKKKGEGDGRVTFFRTLVVHTLNTAVADYCWCFWRTKSSSLGSTDPGGSRDTHRTKRAYENSKIEVIRMMLNQDQSVDLVILITTV